MATLSELQAMAVTFRNDRDWKQFHNFKDMLVSLNLEMAEFSELFQWKSDEEVASLDREPFGEELSDILYWILLFAEDLGINLDEAFEMKSLKNAKKYPIEKARGSKAKYSAMD